MDPETSHQVLLIIMSMSLLGFRDAARTSVLSRFWRNMWRQSGNVEFNERHFSYIEDEIVRRATFVTFVENFMANYVPRTLDKLVIIVHNPLQVILLVEQSIQFAIDRGVRVFGLDFSNPAWGYEQLQRGGNDHLPSYVLPHLVYTHHALESLTLHALTLNTNLVTNFAQLKNLTLGWIHLPRPTLSTLLQNLPLLETLALKNCWNYDGVRIVGNGLRLKTLVMEMFMIYAYTLIEIVAPNLQRFKYFGDFVGFDVTARNLEDVCVELGTSTDGDPSLGDSLYELLRELSSSVLTVCTYMLQVLPMEMISNGVTPRLGVTKLTLKTAMLDCEQLGVKYFLRGCHSLEKLIIQIVPVRIIYIHEAEMMGEVRDDVWSSRHTLSYQCVRETLKEVTVFGYKGTKHEIGFAKYIVSRGLVMKKLRIVIHEELRNQRSRDENLALVTEALMGTSLASGDLDVSVYC